MAGLLTDSQIRALRWIDQFPSTEAEWLVDGKPINNKNAKKEWNQFRIGGSARSIVITLEDQKVISNYVDLCVAPDKLYSLNDAGRSIIAKS